MRREGAMVAASMTLKAPPLSYGEMALVNG
jgi:hypothetical protein